MSASNVNSSLSFSVSLTVCVCVCVRVCVCVCSSYIWNIWAEFKTITNKGHHRTAKTHARTHTRTHTLSQSNMHAHAHKTMHTVIHLFHLQTLSKGIHTYSHILSCLCPACLSPIGLLHSILLSLLRWFVLI